MRTRYEADDHSAFVVLQDWGDGDWYIRSVWTNRLRRHQGVMRELMRQVIADADAEGVVLFLDCGDGSSTGLSSQELRAWYERLGFIGYADRRMARELVEDVPDIQRWDGNALCPNCEKKVYDHGLAEDVLDYQGHPFVHRLCDGTLAKT